MKFIRGGLALALDAVWGLITIVIILGGILSGAFTAVESGAVACVYALFCTMVIHGRSTARCASRC